MPGVLTCVSRSLSRCGIDDASSGANRAGASGTLITICGSHRRASARQNMTLNAGHTGALVAALSIALPDSISDATRTSKEQSWFSLAP